MGKTSIALGLAQLIAEGKVPLNLKDLRERGEGGGEGCFSFYCRIRG